MSDVVTVAIIAALPGVISSLLSYLNGWRLSRLNTKVEKVHEDVNGSLEKMRSVETHAARIMGIAEGRAIEKSENKG